MPLIWLSSLIGSHACPLMAAVAAIFPAFGPRRKRHCHHCAQFRARYLSPLRRSADGAPATSASSNNCYFTNFSRHFDKAGETNILTPPMRTSSLEFHIHFECSASVRKVISCLWKYLHPHPDRTCRSCGSGPLLRSVI
jgi:hypothetical protein